MDGAENEPEIIDQYATLFYEAAPDFDIDALCAAWSAEGYTCEAREPRREKGEEVLAFRGETLVIVSDLAESIDDRFTAGARRLAAFDYDWSVTHVVSPHAALDDLKRARVSVQVRTRVARPRVLAIAANDLVCSLLGIDQVHPFVAAWFEGPGLLVGRADLNEYLAYQNSRIGPPSTPESLHFALEISDEEPNAIGTRVLGFFEHPEFYARTGSFDAVRCVYNAAASVVTGTQMAPGHTLSTGSDFFVVEEGVWRGKPAFQLLAR